MAVVGIVPAAGSGERLGAAGPKAFALCGGRPLLDWSLDVLEAVCDRVVVAVPPGSEEGPDRVAGGAPPPAAAWGGGAGGGWVGGGRAPADNLKVTRQVDLELAEALLRARC